MQPKWTKEQIRKARKAQLMPILIEKSYRLYPLKDDNFRILPDPDDPDAPAGLIVKHSFWTWPERNITGNTIDFFVKVLRLPFNQAMQIIMDDHSCGQKKTNGVASQDMATTRTGMPRRSPTQAGTICDNSAEIDPK